MQLFFSQMFPIILQHTLSGASGGTKYKEKQSFVATKWFANEMLQEYTYLSETLTTQIEKLFSYQSWEFLTLAVYYFNNRVHNVCKWTLFFFFFKWDTRSLLHNTLVALTQKKERDEEPHVFFKIRS